MERKRKSRVCYYHLGLLEQLEIKRQRVIEKLKNPSKRIRKEVRSLETDASSEPVSEGKKTSVNFIKKEKAAEIRRSEDCSGIESKDFWETFEN